MNIKTIMVLLLLTSSMQGFCQTGTEKLIGKWKTEDNAVVEFLKVGTTTIVKQLSAEEEKDKKYNGKQISKDILPLSNKEFKGIVTDPANDKEYNGVWVLAPDGKSLVLKIKWGLMNFSEKWVKQ